MNPSIHFLRTQFLGGGAVGVAQSRIHPHLSPLPLERLNLVAEKCLQEVHPGQPLLTQLLKILTQGLQLAEVLPSHSISPRRQGNGVGTGKRGEWSEGVVPQVKPLLLSPLHRSGHGDFKVGIYSVTCLNMNDSAPRDHHLSFRIL
jgi:hypothetical protein